jgi:phosphoribosylanthranilate isomerase
MALTTFVKISSINNLSDARYCAGMYVNQLGFQLDESSENYISPEKYKEITDWISGVEFVAEFENTHPENILDQVKKYSNISYLQLQEEAHLQLLVNTGFGIIFKVIVNSQKDIEELVKKSVAFMDFDVTLLLESTSNVLPNEWLDVLSDLSKKCQVLIGFGITSQNVNELIQTTGAKGIVLKGGTEIKPGLKDFDELSEILEVLESEDY